MTTVTGPPAPSRNVPDRDVPECPYVGLNPFDEKDAAYFFGRERDSDLIVANLTASRLTLLYAPSGVGKSSVLRAGVLPRLHHINDDSNDDLGVVGAAVAYVSAWRDAPLGSIAAEVSDAVSHVTGAGSVEEGASAPTLSVHWLGEVLRQSRVSMVYLILDQFEEYFLYHPMDHGEEGLTAELGRVLSARDLPVHVLLSIREDALAGLDRFEGRVPHLFDNYFRLEHLSRAAAQAAIEGPLKHYNRLVPPGRTMSIEPGLITTLLDQVRTGHVRVAPEGTAPDKFAAPASDDRGDIDTPYLQLVLTRLWDQERAAGSSSLRQSTLDDLGGAQKIVQTHLDNVMAGLSPAQVDVAAAVFLHLVTTSGTKIALTAEDLVNRSGLPVSAIQDLLETLSAGPKRILRPLPPTVGVAGPSRYEIFHDVLGPAVLELRRQYVAQAEESRKLAAEREKARAEAQAAQAEASRRLAAEREKARAEAQATRRRLRRLLAAGLVVLLIAGVLGVFSYFKSREAAQQRLLGEAAVALGDNPVLSLRKAVEAYRISDDEKAREAVLTAASVPRSRVVAGSGSPDDPRVAGMVVTPDQRHVVTYDAQGGIRVIGGDGRVDKKEAKASRLAGTVVTAATSPNASHVVLATDRGSAAVIDVGTGTQVDLTTDGSPVHTVSWLDLPPDNLVLVVTSSGLATTYSAATYSAKTGRQLTRFPSTVHEVLPIGAQVVTSDRDSRLRVWDARTAEKVAESSPLPSPPEYLQRYRHEVVGVVAGVTGDRNIIRWDWRASPKLPRIYPISFSSTLAQVAVSEETHTVTIAVDKEAKTYSLHDGSPQRILPQQPDQVSGVALAPGGRWIATAGAGGRVRVWSAKGIGIPNRATYDLIARDGGVQSVSYLRDGKSLISLGDNGTVRLWDLPQIQRFDLHKSWVLDLDVSADGRWLATASLDGDVHIVDPAAASNVKVATVRVDTRVTDVQFDPTDPHRIFTLTRYGKQPEGWRWDSGRGAERLPGFEAPPPGPLGPSKLVSLDISQDGKRVAARDFRGNVYLWDAHTGKLIGDPALTGSGRGEFDIAFDPSGHMLAATGPGGVLLKKLGTQEEPKLLEFPDATTVAFDPRGEHIVGGANGILRIWTRDGQRVHKHDLVAHGSTVGRPSFSGDDGLVAVGTSAGFIEVWNVKSGRRVMLARQHGNAVNDVLFLPGRPSRLVSASDDSTVAVFSCDACEDPDAVIRDADR